jgi:hypothetical protein
MLYARVSNMFLSPELQPWQAEFVPGEDGGLLSTLCSKARVAKPSGI